MQYHYADHDNQVMGPVTEEELHALYRTGTITADTNIFQEGGSDWRAYRSMAAIVPPPPSRALARPVEVARLEPIPVGPSTRQCPFCAEDILIQAKKCKHCGETIDVALRAAEEAKRASERPMVFMNAGGGGGAAAAAASTSRPVVVVANRKSGIVAAFLNIILPGFGYMYCGRTILGFLVFVFTLALAAGTGGAALFILYPIFFIDGFLAAGRANRQVVVVS